MANKKKKTKNSNSYWMKWGGHPKKMRKYHDGSFTHPHPHPKNASDDVLQGAQLFSTYKTTEGKPLTKRTNYTWDDETQQKQFEAFQNSKWYNFFPDTLKDVPKNIEQLNKYEEAIGANRTRTIQLHDTDFSWDDAILYGGAPAAAWFGASNVANAVPTPYTQIAGWGMKGLGGLIVGGKLMYDLAHKRGENERMKKENPYATFVNSEGEILNYEDGNGLFFDLFHPNNNSEYFTVNKGIRDTPIEREDTKTKEITWEMGGNPLYKYDSGGNPNSQETITEDPTFKMWFAKNANRSDVMQSSSDPVALKDLFLRDINFPGNEMPLFSGEIDGFGNIDKSNRTPELSSRIIGGMKKFGGHGHSYKTPRLPKAELGMGSQWYDLPDATTVRDYSDVNEIGRDGRNSNVQQTIGAVGEDGTVANKILKAFNYVVPGLGTGLDIVADIFRHRGDVKQHEANVKDANEAVNTARTLNKEGVNKETLRFDTRLGGLEAISSYLGTEKPKFNWGELAGNVMSIGSNYAGDIGKLFNKGTGDTPIPYGEIGADDIAPLPAGSAMYGGSPYRHKKQMGGGAIDLQPGNAVDLIGHQFNPLGQSAMFEAQGTAGNSFNAGGQPNSDSVDYEAEGGEAIMHQPGDIPVTTADTEQVDGDMNDAMISMLEGSSHEKGGEIVQSSEGQYVFSKSLKSKTWNMSYADAAEKIGNHIAKFKKEMEEGDEITKSTAVSMIDAWNQKLTDLQTEQEASRQEKFMDLLNSGATEDELYEKFPDIFEQYMQQQQTQALSEQAMASIAGPAGGMQDNPMGNIDMSQLSAEDQQLVGAKYGLPQAENGFDPYNFNRYFGETFSDIEFDDFSLNKRYEPNRGDVMDWLTANYPDGGFSINDETFTDPKDAYKALMSGYGDWRSGQLENIGVPGSKPDRDTYMDEFMVMNPHTGKEDMETWDWKPATEDGYLGGKEEFTKDKANYNLYNMGLGVGWDENFGLDNDMSKRQYFKALEQSLLADGKSPEDVASILDRERIKYDENLENLENIEKNKPLDPAEEAALAAKKARNAEMMKNLMSAFKKGATDLKTLAPTLYNFKKAKEGVEYEPFVSNENEALIKENLKRLTNSLDIQNLLEENETNFNMLKYLGRDASDGSSGSMMNMLLRGQNIQNEADLKAFLTEAQLENQGLQIANESLFNLGERDRQEGVRQNEANAMNRAAKEAFEAKGWEGLSGYSQLKDKMANEMSTDKNLANMLNLIYPDAHLYIGKDGSFDIQKLIDSGELNKLMQQYPQLKNIIGDYIK